MQDKHLFEYAVIRVVPKIEREEFINVGLILFSKRAKYIQVRYTVNENKLYQFETELDTDTLYDYLDAFCRVCLGNKEGGKIASFDIPERFRWLTAVRSSCIQTSRPHCGMSDDLDQTFDQLYTELVL